MNHFMLMLIIPFLTVMIEGPELCFDNGGEMHLSCCCKSDVSIKGSCCSSGCSKVEITVSSMLTRVVQLDPEDADSGSDDSFEKFISTSVSKWKYDLTYNLFSDRLSRSSPGIDLKLSKTILRC